MLTPRYYLREIFRLFKTSLQHSPMLCAPCKRENCCGSRGNLTKKSTISFPDWRCTMPIMSEAGGRSSVFMGREPSSLDTTGKILKSSFLW